MQFKGDKLKFEDYPEIKNLNWIDNVYKLVNNPPPPRYHDNCPVGWRTTTIDDIAQFLPQLSGKELDEAWRKFQCADLILMDWIPSSQTDPEHPGMYIKMFPILNFQEPGMYNCLGYCKDLSLKPSLEQPNVMDQKKKKMEDHREEYNLEIRWSRTTPEPKDPCGGKPRPPWKSKPWTPSLEFHCCGMSTINSKPHTPCSPPLFPLPKESLLPPLQPSENPCKQYKHLFNVSIMSEEDWTNYDRMKDHGYKRQPWVRLPTLNFLPSGIDSIIAGEKGYLVVDGHWQPRDTKCEYDLSMQDSWDLSMYPAQTITIICNPLLKRFDYIPPFPNKTLNHKMAHMEVKPDPENEEGSNVFNIYFVGYNFISEIDKHRNDEFLTLDQKKDISCPNEVIVAIYNSNMKDWTGTFSRMFVRHLPTNQSNDLAFVDNKLFWVSEWADHGKKIKMQNNTFEPPELKWIPVISCFDLETNEFTGFAFCQELYHKKIENCLVMECNKNLYIVSRTTITNKKVPQGSFEVRLATYKEGNPKLKFKTVGTMPLSQYEYLFQNYYRCFDRTLGPIYQCRAGFTTICFYVPQCGTGVLFDVDKCVWTNMDLHCGWNLDQKASQHLPNWSKNALVSCVWEPNFKALWTKEYKGPQWAPTGDDLICPNRWNECI